MKNVLNFVIHDKQSRGLRTKHANCLEDDELYILYTSDALKPTHANGLEARLKLSLLFVTGMRHNELALLQTWQVTERKQSGSDVIIIKKKMGSTAGDSKRDRGGISDASSSRAEVVIFLKTPLGAP